MRRSLRRADAEIAMIEIVGLGQLFDSLPVRAVDGLSRADQIVLQTAQGACAQEILARYDNVVALDDTYDSAEDFDQLYVIGAQKVMEYAREANSTCFCCLGLPQDNGFVEELGRRTQTQIIGQTDPAAEAVYLSGGLLSVEDYAAFEARTLRHKYIDTSNAVVVVGIDDAYTASEVAIALGEVYADDFQGVLVLDGEVRTLSVEELSQPRDWAPYGVFVLPAVDFLQKQRFTYVDALRVMEVLRSPDGCPWDLQQTHESLRPYLVEEAYEVSEAAGDADMAALADELGDVLLQVIFHAQIGRELSEFTDVDVTTALCEKMIRRHPHVFGDESAETAQDVLVKWDEIKRAEAGREYEDSALSGVPRGMDPLLRAYKLQNKAAKVGFDWPEPEGAVEKTREEVDEFAAELAGDDPAKQREEAGDLLFAAVNALRKAGIDPQSALQDACSKFTRRFEYIERHAPRRLNDMSLEEMDKLWDDAKRAERSQK